MRAPRLALRLLGRDWRAGELRLLAAAVVIAVAAVSAVSWLGDRVARASGGQAAELLAADALVRSDDPIPAAWLSKADELGLEWARTAEFPSVVLAGEATQLVSVKAVEEGYPLRGRLQLASELGADFESARAVPKPGAAWAETRLLGPLSLQLGDALELGRSEFRLTALITLEPDRGGFFSTLAPRLMINLEDLAATGLIQPASRVRYALLLAGEEGRLARYRSWLDAETSGGAAWRTPADANPGVGGVLERAERFLGLSALLTVVIAGVAMLLTVRRYAARQVDRVAIMRCLGATQAEVSSLLAWKLAWLALFGGACGLVLGFGLHHLMLALVRDLLPEALPGPGWKPLASGWLTAFAALIGFALPTVLRLRRVPPLRVLRRELGEGVFRGSSLYLGALLAIFALMWWQAGEARLAVLVFASVLTALVALAALAWLLVRALRTLRGGRQRLLWLSGITRRPATAAVQIMGIGVGLMALFLLTVVREDLLSAWQDRIPADAPNYFLINVQPEQVAPLQTLLAANGVVEPALYPMVRGRLVAIDGRTVGPGDYEDERARRLLSREFNLSSSATMSSDNRVVAGRWWDEPAPATDQFSVELGIAEALGIELGDTLSFEVAGQLATGTVSSLRTVEWDSFNVNFFVTSPPGLLDGFPATYITSFYLPGERQTLLTELVRQYPSVTVFDINGILRTVRGIVDQGVKVVELMAALTLLAGIIVLLAALQITGEERRFESAMLRTLGASRARIRAMARSEFLLIGAASGGLAGGGAAISGAVLARELFELDYAPEPWLPLASALLGALIVWLAGAFGTRRFYRGSPMRLLRGGAEP